MAAHSVAVGCKHHGIAIECPLRIRAEIAALRNVYRLLAAVCLDDCHIAVRVVTVSDNFQRKPFAVGRPTVTESEFEPERPVGHLLNLSAVQINYHQFVFALDKGEFFPVGRELRRLTVDTVVGRQTLFVDECCIREVQVFATLDGCTIDAPHAITFRSVCNRTIVGSKAYVCFSRFGCGDTLGCRIFHGSDKNLATRHKSHLLAVGRRHCSRHATTYAYRLRQIGIVVDYAYLNFLRLCRR